jgi:hypothetical protein
LQFGQWNERDRPPQASRTASAQPRTSHQVADGAAREAPEAQQLKHWRLCDLGRSSPEAERHLSRIKREMKAVRESDLIRRRWFLSISLDHSLKLSQTQKPLQRGCAVRPAALL